DIKNAKVDFLAQSLFPVYVIHSEKSFAVKIINDKEMAETEFKSLEILYKNYIPCPKPYSLTDSSEGSLLLMDFISSSNSNKENHFVESLTSLYSIKNKSWGLDFSNFIGTLPQPNSFYDNFYDYFWTSRLEPQVDMGIKTRRLNSNHKVKLEKLLTKSLTWGIGDIGPRLIHGDLWAGNAIWGDKMYLIDPSIAYGHPEQDLGMADLFGGFPLFKADEVLKNVGIDSSGWRDRVSFWQIYPLLVHVNIFGSSYVSGLENAMNKYLR
ncbi:MAG: fructosamine kinase family protein, partial [Leptospiraceae bacterium]|nr:fructosamine kinase family protein [Leptospiraceae bacterium]